MEINDCLSAIKRYFGLIAAITIIAAASSWVVSHFILENIYESTTTIIMSGKNTLSNGDKLCEYDVLLDKNLIKVFYNIAESESVAEEVIKKLKLRYTVDEIRKLIEIDVEEETGIIRISVRTNSANLSRNIVQAFVESLRNQSHNFILKAYIHTIDPPKLPVKPSSPNMILNLLLSITGGVMAGILMAILLGAKEQTKTSIFALNKLPWLFNIGSFPSLKSIKNKNIQRVYPNNRVAFESLKAIRTNLLYLLERDSINTIMFTSSGVSEGKTTIAVNTAVAVAQLHKRVLLIDCNFQKPALYKIINSKSETAQRDATSYRKINGYIVKSVPGLGIDVISDIMAPREKSNVNFSLINTMLDAIKNDYDLIMLDCPPVMSNADTLALAKITKNVVVVADYRHISYKVIEESIQRLTQIDSKILGIVVNHVPRKKFFR